MFGVDQYQLNFVNGLSGDPAVHVYFPVLGQGIQFDLGSLNNFSHKLLLKTRIFMVSHTHIDHFFGLDRLIRINIPHRRKVMLAGPKGFARKVWHRFNSYSWNLLETGQITFVVWEISKESATCFELCNDDDFQPRQTISIPSIKGISTIELASGASISACPLDHGIDSVAYRYHFPIRSKVDINRIKQDGLAEGKWIKHLQKKVAQGELDHKIDVGGKPWLVNDLASCYLEKIDRFSICYLTDVAFTRNNLDKVKSLFASSDVLISESSFMDCDRNRALAKKHLTTKQAALLARICDVKDLKVFHFSNIYAGKTDQVEDEASLCFSQFKAMNLSELGEQIDVELNS